MPKDKAKSRRWLKKERIAESSKGNCVFEDFYALEDRKNRHARQSLSPQKDQPKGRSEERKIKLSEYFADIAVSTRSSNSSKER